MIKDESMTKYKAFPFKRKCDVPAMPKWLQADPEAKKRLELRRKQGKC